jgi:gas vesicle protein
VKSTANQISDTVRSTSGEISAKANETLVAAKGAAQSIADKSKAFFADQKARVVESVDAGKQAAEDKRHELETANGADVPVTT